MASKKVTIEQTGIIARQGDQYFIVIQKKNWPAIEPFLDIKVDEQIVLERITLEPKNKSN